MGAQHMIVVDLSILYAEKAKIADLSDYVNKVLKLVGEGNHVVLTGHAPIWLYLTVAHALHGKATTLSYRSPVTGDVVIFDHDPY